MAGAPQPTRPHRARRIAVWAGVVLAVLVALAVVTAVAIDTPGGHRLLAELVAGQRQPNGLEVRVGRIDGSIYGRMVLRDVAVSDPKGVFATSPAIVVAWRPGALVHKHVLIDVLSADTIRLLRAPALKPTPPKPLPDIYLTVRSFGVNALLLEPALTGDRRSLGLSGGVELLDRRVRVDAAAAARTVDGHAGGDHLALHVDAEPDRNRLAIEAHLVAPEGGVVARLAHLHAPLTADLGGRGDWRSWGGRAVAMLGGRPLLEASLAGRGGVFSASGQAHPDLVLTGPLAALTHPALGFEFGGRLAKRQLDATVRLASDAFTVTGAGRLDLAQGRYRGVRIDARLLKPGAAAARMSGRDILAALALDGAFAHPVVDYDIRAGQIGFGSVAVEDLHATGRAVVDARSTLRLPVHATASRVTGMPATVGGLTNNMRLDGDFVITPRQIASDDLRLRSDRLQATAVLTLSLQTGRYDGALKGAINRYGVPGLGIVDVTTDARLIPIGRGEFSIAGHVNGRTLRLDNASADRFLGGNARLSADFSRSPDGVLGLAHLRLTAPRLRIVDGGGTFAPGGRIGFTAEAVSSAYGPARLDVGGAFSAPQVRLRAPDPRIGGLTNVDVRAGAAGAGAYHVTATATSPYGPLVADAQLRPGAGGMQAAIRRASLDGIGVTGEVRQIPAGPFAGLLRVSGSGLNGTLRLSAEGKLQRADAALTASRARLPLRPPMTVARGSISAAAVLYPGGPAVSARADLTGVRQGQLLVNRAGATVDYRGGAGQVRLTASGQSGVPFTLAIAADISPSVIRVNGQGSLRGETIRLAAPAEIRRRNGEFVLAPARFLLPSGEVDISGLFGKGLSLSARVQNADLSMTEAFAPSLGLGGKLSGSLDVSQPAGGAAPTARARLQVAGFTRTTLTAASDPIDLTAVGELGRSSATAAVVARRRGVVIGRMQAQLTPGPATTAGPWMRRFLAAPLAAGVRYNGPAEALWAISGIAGQEVAGPIAIGADVTGRLDQPRITGVVRSQTLRYENTTFGTVVDRIAIDGRFTDTRLEINSFTGRAGRGSLQARGYADLSAAKGFPIDLRITLADAALARSNTVEATVSGSLAITNSKTAGALVSGDLRVDKASYEVARQGSAEVVELTGVRRNGHPLEAPGPSSTTRPPSLWRLNIGVHAPSQLFVRGMGLDAEWRSDLQITGDAAHPVIVGDIDLVRGTFAFAGRELSLSRGVIHLNGAQPPDPTLDIQASSTVEGVTATITIAGTAQSPEITFSSTPALPEDEVLSRLLFGTSVTSLSPLQAVQLAAALNSLRSRGGGLNPIGKLRRVAGLDQLRFYGADQTTGRGPAVGAGRYIGKNLYVEVITDARGYTATQIEIALSRALRILSQVGTAGGSNLTLRYSHDY